jgi:hypothetical protein
MAGSDPADAAPQRNIGLSALPGAPLDTPRGDGAGRVATAIRSRADAEAKFVLAVSVTSAEIEHYARRLRERCDRTLAVDRDA